jgi:hypothetical protein
VFGKRVDLILKYHNTMDADEPSGEWFHEHERASFFLWQCYSCHSLFLNRVTFFSSSCSLDDNRPTFSDEEDRDHVVYPERNKSKLRDTCRVPVAKGYFIKDDFRPYQDGTCEYFCFVCKKPATALCLFFEDRFQICQCLSCRNFSGNVISAGDVNAATPSMTDKIPRKRGHDDV